MHTYIASTVKAIGDYPIAWDVVNEAIDDGSGYIRESPWSKVPDFVCKAFKAARSANPYVGRFYNDYGFTYDAKKSAKILKLVKDLQDRDCGITGVGF